MLMVATLAGCSSSEPEAEPAEWGVEAVQYFARLADAYNDNDIYGILDYVDHDTVDGILALSGRTAWDDLGVPWIERGVEYAADVIAWGLIDETLPMVRLGAPPCTELAAAFTQLTGAPLASDRCP